MPLTTFIICFILYYALHSILADLKIKAKLQTLIPQKLYRIFYNIMAISTLSGIVWLYFQIEKEMILEEAFLLNLLGLIILGIGILLNFFTMKSYNLKEFTGTKYLNEVSTRSKESLRISGLNGMVRHPLYLSILLIVWGVFFILLNTGVLAIASVTTIYIPIGIYFEEQKLIEEFGEEYVDYKKKVKMIVPYFI